MVLRNRGYFGGEIMLDKITLNLTCKIHIRSWRGEALRRLSDSTRHRYLSSCFLYNSVCESLLHEGRNESRCGLCNEVK